MYWMTAYLVPTLGVLFLSYAVFDTMAIADARRSGRELPETDDETMKAVWERVLLNRRTGWVGPPDRGRRGDPAPVRRAVQPLDHWPLLSVSFPLTALVIPVILLVIGILLLKRSRK